MGRGRDRGHKRRSYGDDDDAPPDWSVGRPPQSFSKAPRYEAAPTGPAIDGTVKWFNPEKGFGFVELADGSGDVFLHISTLEAAGHESLEAGTKVSVQVGVGKRGRQITAILGADGSSAVSPAQPRQAARKPLGRERPDPSTATTVEGTVKFYNAHKGFGFVVCEDGEKDVFVHVSVVERAGLRGLEEGQRLSMQVVKAPKGREAISVTLLGQ